MRSSTGSIGAPVWWAWTKLTSWVRAWWILLSGWPDSGKQVIIAGLDTDYMGRPFSPMPELLAYAESITKTLAIWRLPLFDLRHHPGHLSAMSVLLSHASFYIIGTVSKKTSFRGWTVNFLLIEAGWDKVFGEAIATDHSNIQMAAAEHFAGLRVAA